MRILKKGFIVVALLICAWVVHRSQTELDKARFITFRDESPVLLPKGEVLKWLSMGYRGLVSDWMWIRCVLYYGRRARDEENPYYRLALVKGEEKPVPEIYPRGEMPGPDSLDTLGRQLKHLLFQGENPALVQAIYPLLDRVTTLDPHFVFPYLFGGVYVLMETGEIGEAKKLLEKGYHNNPDRWEFPLYLGWLYWMYFADMDSTIRYLEEAVGKSGCPDYVYSLMEGLSLKLNRTLITRRYLEGLIETTNNPEIRERLQSILDHLQNTENKY